MTVNNTTFAGLLKKHYSQKQVLNMAYKDRPFLGLVPKDENWGGSNYELPTIYGNPVAGRSQSISYGSTNRTNAQVRNVVFSLTSTQNYNEALISGETIASSRTNQGRDVFLKALPATVDGVIDAIANDLSFALFRDGSGARGQIKVGSTVTSATTITLENARDAHYFEVGMVVVAGSGSAGTNIKETGTTQNALSVSAVDRSAGTVTFSAAVDSFGSNDWAAGDYLFVQGDPASKLSGLADWVDHNSSPAALFGVTRTTDRDRLAGVSISASATIEETLIDAMAELNIRGGRPSHIFMNPIDFASLTKELGSTVQRDVMSGKTGVGYQTIKVWGAGGAVDVVPDRGCPKGRCYVLDLSTWVLASRGPLIRIDDDDGSMYDRVDGSDAIVVRAKSYAQLGCRAPGRNATVALP